MGTSAKNSGPGQSSPLIPSWLQPAVPSSEQASADPATDIPAEVQKELPVLPPLSEEADPARFKTAKVYFNKLAKSGRGSGNKGLRKAIAEYVRRGYGSGRNAAGRMSNSTRIAGNILAFAQAIRDRGFESAVKEFSLQALIGKPIQDAVSILIEIFAGPATTTDDNIARDAWCEALKEIVENGTTDIENLTPVQWANAVEIFLCKAIELRIFNEIGNDSVGLVLDVRKLDEIENDLISLVRHQVQNTIVPLIEDNQKQSLEELNQYMSSIVDMAFDYLAALEGEED